jgi:hypothetical protein
MAAVIVVPVSVTPDSAPPLLFEAASIWVATHWPPALLASISTARPLVRPEKPPPIRSNLVPAVTLKVSLAPLSVRTWTVLADELLVMTVASKWRTAAWAPPAKTTTPSAAQTALRTKMDETRFLIEFPSWGSFA